MRSIKILEEEIKQLNKLIKTKLNQKQSVRNKWMYLKHAKEGQVRSLKEVLEVIDEIKKKYIIKGWVQGEELINKIKVKISQKAGAK